MEPAPPPGPDDPRPAGGGEVVAAAGAAFVLGSNSGAGIVKSAPGLYPHQWSWDTAFIAIGLAPIDTALACRNLDALFAGQWHNGMVPHIVFDPAARGYFPGPDRWACADLTSQAPTAPLTSGICQPPVHAIAASKIVARAMDRGGQQGSAARAWARGIHPKLLVWHRFLARERVDEKTGLVRIFHGWESGMDNSPRWDGPYSRIAVPDGLPPYHRRDLEHVGDARQRPTQAEYDRYLWLVEEAKQAHYDQAELARVSSFNVGDVFFTAIFATANDHLADLAELVGAAGASELRQYASQARAAVNGRVEPSTGLATDVDLRTGEVLATETVAGFAPLVAGGLPAPARQGLVQLLMGPRWAGHPGLRWPLPPSTSACSPSFQPRSYWRGPVWPVITWLLGWALERDGEPTPAAALRQATLRQLEDATFAEYYEPFTAEPLGSAYQSWTAAVALDWLCQ
jgi:hypothetical protein